MVDEKKIKSRASYRFFSELMSFFKEKPSTAESLIKIWEIVDSRKGFGSEYNAEAAKESLDYLIIENKLQRR